MTNGHGTEARSEGLRMRPRTGVAGAAAFGTALTLPFAASAAWAAPTCACGGGSPPPPPDEVKAGEHLAQAPTEAAPPPAHPPAPSPSPAATAPRKFAPAPASPPVAKPPAAAPPAPVKPAEHQALRPTPVEPPPPAPSAPPATVKPAEHQALRPSGPDASATGPSPAEPPVPEPPTPDVSGMSPDAAERWLASAEERESVAEAAAPASEPPPEPPPAPAEPVAADELPPPPDGTVRLMTYNIGRGASWNHGEGTDPNQLDDVAQQIADSEADVVALQEVYSGDMDEQAGIGGFHSTPGDTERITDMLREDHGAEYQVVEGPASRKCELDDNVFRDFRCGGFGNAILVRNEGDVDGVVEGSEENRELPPDGDEGRTLTEAEISVDGTAVDVFTTHISSRGEPEEPNVIDPQVPQIGAAMDAVEDTRGPAILAGDFNVTLGSDRSSAEEINRFDELGLTDAAADAGATSTCGEGRRIDYIFTRDLVPVAAYNVDCGPSDHNALVVDVRLQD